jgi:TRAP transporter TAXI family solute receptor
MPVGGLARVERNGGAMVRKVAERTQKIARQLATPDVSFRELASGQWRDLALILVPALIALIGVVWFASRFVEPAPPKKIWITTGGQSGGYFATGKRYADILKRSGITLEVLTSAGSVENLKRLSDPALNVDVALLQGGTTTTKQSPGIISLGRVYLEPMWVFYRSDTAVDRLAALKGKRIAVGPEGSGTRPLALALLERNGITTANSEFLPILGAELIAAVVDGRADAAFMTSSIESPQVQTLLKTPGVRLMNFPQAEAYTRIFPYLTRIVLPKGAVDLANNLPEADVEMVAPMAALVAREDLHPALVGLLVEAAKEVHSRGGMFNRQGEFPKAQDPEFEMSDDAERVYKSGPPALQKFLPFWLATFLERIKVMILPIATIVLPLFKLIPAIYKWRIRRRMLYWYGELKALEFNVFRDAGNTRLAEHETEMTRIEQAVASITVPLAFSDQYYSLRAAVDIVRNTLRGQGSTQLDGTPVAAR